MADFNSSTKSLMYTAQKVSEYGVIYGIFLYSDATDQKKLRNLTIFT